MARVMIIKDYNSGKILKKVTIKTSDSIEYECKYIGGRKFLVISSYYDGRPIQKINVDNFGSIEYWATNEEDEW